MKIFQPTTGGGGGGGGTLTSISQGNGITLTPNPITTTGTVTANLIGSTSGLASGTTPGATHETWLGEGAGSSSASKTNTVMIGLNAGAASTGTVTNMIAIGNGAGQNLIGGDAHGIISIGSSAGSGAINASRSIFMSSGAGGGALRADDSYFFGNLAGNGATDAFNSFFVGSQAGQGAVQAAGSNFLGGGAGALALNANDSIFIGNHAGFQATNAAHGIFLGENAGQNDTVNNTGPDPTGSYGFSILIGQNTNTGGFSNSILMGGVDSGTISNTKTNQFMLADTIVNARWSGIEYIFPSAYGSAGNVLTDTDGAGTLAWTTGGGGTPTLTFTQIAYGDPSNLMTSDTNFTRTTQGITLNSNVAGALADIFISGGNPTTIPANNIGIGSGAMSAIIGNSPFDGYENIAIGDASLNNSTNGSRNIVIGYQAGQSIITGSDNLIVGRFANTSGDLSGTIVIGRDATATLSNQMIVGSTNVPVTALQIIADGSGNAILSLSANATNESWIGFGAGSGGASTDGTVFIGTGVFGGAGAGATGALQSTFIGGGFTGGSGQAAGGNSTDAFQSVFIGNRSGVNSANANNSTFIGTGAGSDVPNAAFSIFIGDGTGSAAVNADHCIFIGTTNTGVGDTVVNSGFQITYSVGGTSPYIENEMITGQTSGATATVRSDDGMGSMLVVLQTGTFTSSEVLLGGTSGSDGTFISETSFEQLSSSILIGQNANTGGFYDSIGIGIGAVNTKTKQFFVPGTYTHITFPGIVGNTVTPVGNVVIDSSGELGVSAGIVPSVVASADLTVQTSAIADILALGTGAYTPPIDSTYKIGGYVTVNSILLTPILNVWVDYVNQEGTAIHKGLIFQTVSNTPSSVVTIQVATTYYAYDFEIRAQAGTAITFSTTQTGTINYDIGITLMNVR